MWLLAKNNSAGILSGMQVAAPTVYVEFKNLSLGLTQILKNRLLLY